MRKKIYEQMGFELQLSASAGIGNLTVTSKEFNSSVMNIAESSYVNFAICDYLRLSQDERVKEGAIKALRDYGVYTAISRTYVKLQIYKTAEDHLQEIFKKPVLLFPRTTLAHLGVLPIISDTDDAIILDQHVHTSVRLSADLVKGYGNHIETIRHNNMESLEEKINELKYKYKKIWYLADSIYSMYGDIFPFKELNRLLNQYEQFHLYVDDAHGMSWRGLNGSGFLLECMPYHPKLALITSLGKGFGAGAGVMVCNNHKIKDMISKCSAPLSFTSPVSPSTLGAIIESAKIHLTDEIYEKQENLKERINLFYNEARRLNLPIISTRNTPIGFIAVGKPDMCRDISKGLMDNGYYASPAHFPAVPFNNSGIRITINISQSNEEIIGLLTTLKTEYDKALKKRGITTEEILSHYNKKTKHELAHTH